MHTTIVVLYTRSILTTARTCTREANEGGPHTHWVQTALLHLVNLGHTLACFRGIRRSDYERELVERCGDGQTVKCIGPEFVVSSP